MKRISTIIGTIIFPILLPFFLSLSLYARVLIISDLDDTIKITGVKSTAMISNYLTGVEPFDQLIKIYQETIDYYQFKGEEVDMVYLTSAPRAVNSQAWLDQYHAPKGRLIERRNREMITVSGKEHKLNALAELMNSASSYSTILFFGDNGENDPVVYTQTVRKFKLEAKSRIFIRDVMVTATEVYPGMKLERLPLVDYFLTEVDLIDDFSFLSVALVQEIIESREREALPDFMLDRLYERLEARE